MSVCVDGTKLSIPYYNNTKLTKIYFNNTLVFLRVTSFSATLKTSSVTDLRESGSDVTTRFALATTSVSESACISVSGGVITFNQSFSSVKFTFTGAQQRLGNIYHAGTVTLKILVNGVVKSTASYATCYPNDGWTSSTVTWTGSINEGDKVQVQASIPGTTQQSGCRFNGGATLGISATA